MCRYATECGADYVLGVDYDSSAIAEAMELSDGYGIDFLTDDIDNYIFYTNLPAFDTCLFLSVIGTKELQHRYGILARAASKTKQVMYVEGHHNVFRRRELQRAILTYTTFTCIEYIGETYDQPDDKKAKRSRDLFRCSRKIHSRSEVIKTLSEMTADKVGKTIAIQGHGGVGKSTFKRELIHFLNNNTEHKFDTDSLPDKGCEISENEMVCIVDDVKPKRLKKLRNRHRTIIYFDYRVIDYTKDWEVDTLFIMNYDIKTRYQTRPQFIHNRTPPIAYPFIKNIYHIEKF